MEGDSKTSGHNFVCNDCVFDGTSTESSGTAIFAYRGNVVTVNRGWCRNTMAPKDTGCVRLEENSNGYFTEFHMINNTAQNQVC